MAEFTKTPIDWQNEGTEPSANLKQNGFQAGYKPPADVFNHHFHNTNACISEIQEKFSSLEGTDGGFQFGANSETESGASAGTGATSTTGGAIGYNSGTETGGAIGENAYAQYGGAIGENAMATGGGAVGYYADAGNGFSGGYQAGVLYENGTPIDCIQLGTGINEEAKSLQVYETKLMKADGTIPLERFFKKVVSNKILSLAAGTQTNYFEYTKTASNKLLFVNQQTSLNTSTGESVASVIFVNPSTNNVCRIYVQRGAGVAANIGVSTIFDIYEIG